MHVLEAVLTHRAINLIQEPGIDLHPVLRSDPHEVAVARSVMDLAKCHPVGDDGIASLFGIPDDVRRIQQLGMSKPTDCAGRRVCVEHLLSEHGPVKAQPCHSGRVDLLRGRERPERTVGLLGAALGRGQG